MKKALINKNQYIIDYNQEAAVYDTKRYEGRIDVFKEELRHRAIVKMIDLDLKMDVLDVATGTGRGILYMVPKCRHIIGVDASAAMIEKGKEKLTKFGYKNVEFKLANALDLPFEDNSFDIVTSFNFLHLFKSIETQKLFVEEMKRVLKNNGILLIELENAFHGLVLGFIRKYFLYDVGYTWPHQINRILGENMKLIKVMGVNLPIIWRACSLNKQIVFSIERLAYFFPFNYLGHRVLVKARKITY